jgi:hypothetical protein
MDRTREEATSYINLPSLLNLDNLVYPFAFVVSLALEE